jgi:hypothetical protein
MTLIAMPNAMTLWMASIGVSSIAPTGEVSESVKGEPEWR